MRREKKSAAVSRLSPSAALALPSTHSRPFAPRQRGSRFQPWGLERPKGRHRPARLCRGSPEAASYLCSGRPGAAGGGLGAGDQHQGAETLGRSGAVCRAGRAPRCLPGASHPWSAKFLRAQRRRGTSARCDLRGAWSGSFPGSISGSRARSGSAVPLLPLFTGGRCAARGPGGIPLAPARGVVAAAVALARSLSPSLAVALPASGQSDAQPQHRRCVVSRRQRS